MNMKLSHIALALLASTSFYAAAETIVAGSAVTAEADIVVSADSSFALLINPLEGLTVSDFKKKDQKLGEFSVSEDAYVRIVGNESKPNRRQCTFIYGESNSQNKIEVCTSGSPGILASVNGTYYYSYEAQKKHSIVTGGYNTDPSVTNVNPDTYKISMEAIRRNI